MRGLAAGPSSGPSGRLLPPFDGLWGEGFALRFRSRAGWISGAGARFMNQILIQDYFNEIDRLKKFSGSATGASLPAFKDSLKAWARRADQVFVPQDDSCRRRKTASARTARFCTIRACRSALGRPRILPTIATRKSKKARQGLSAGQYHFRKFRNRRPDPEPARGFSPRQARRRAPCSKSGLPAHNRCEIE